MPRIIELATETSERIRDRVLRAIAKIKPGQCIVAAELAQELGTVIMAIRRYIPESQRVVRCVKGYRAPVLLITAPTQPTTPCHAKSKSPAKRKKS